MVSKLRFFSPRTGFRRTAGLIETDLNVTNTGHCLAKSNTTVVILNEVKDLMFFPTSTEKHEILPAIRITVRMTTA